MLKQFVISFVTLFCLANFVIGTATYLLFPDQVSSPIPEGSVMLRIGLITGVVTIVKFLRGAHAT